MKVSLRLVDSHTREFVVGERTLARYSSAPVGVAAESPKPCLHPVRTLSGEVITDFRPADHPWHRGIAWAFTYIDEVNFWGGPTYRREAGSYVWEQNHGRQVHRAWLTAEDDTSTATMVEEVDWVGPDGGLVLRERRQIAADIFSADAWRLSLSSCFTNPSDRARSLESPVCRGRPEGGYFGLMWRGAPTWAFGEILAADPQIASVMGQSSPWIAYRQSESTPAASTLLLVDYPDNPGFPTQWFARCQDQPLASFSFAYDRPLVLPPGKQLAVRCDFVIFDGRIDRARLNEAARRVAGPVVCEAE